MFIDAIEYIKAGQREKKMTDPSDAINKALMEFNNGSNGSTEQKEPCYNFRVTEINRVLDGDTIDVTIDLGFDLYKKERVRVAGVDTPEKRTRDLEEKALGIDATNWLKEKLEGAIDGDDELTIRTELKGGLVSMVGCLVGYILVMRNYRSTN